MQHRKKRNQHRHQLNCRHAEYHRISKHDVANDSYWRGIGGFRQHVKQGRHFYEEEVDEAADGLASLMEPIIMVVLGALIGGLVIAMYMPIFKLGEVVGG